MYEDEVLALLSRHVETGEPLPAHLAEKLIALRHLNEGMYCLMGRGGGVAPRLQSYDQRISPALLLLPPCR